jgi:hypothetical protein
VFPALFIIRAGNGLEISHGYSPVSSQGTKNQPQGLVVSSKDEHHVYAKRAAIKVWRGIISCIMIFLLFMMGILIALRIFCK